MEKQGDPEAPYTTASCKNCDFLAQSGPEDLMEGTDLVWARQFVEEDGWLHEQREVGHEVVVLYHY
jgi:hypothetical protein